MGVIMGARLVAIGMGALLLSGCAAAPDLERNTLIGVGAGAGVGALVGLAAGGPTAAWIGAAVGGAAGGVIGYLVRPDGCYFRNQRGELWQVPCDPRITGSVTCYVGNEISGLREIRCPYLARRG